MAAFASVTPFVSAATFTVTSTADPGDGVCDGSCTLRDAILSATLNPGTDTIAFSIPGTPPFVIAPASLLPEFSDVVIDGYTQPGSQPSTSSTGSNAILTIAIDGEGLVVRAGPAGGIAVIRGLAIQNSAGPAITLHSGGDSVLGCRLGTDVTGTVARPNSSGIAIYWTSAYNHIGGSSPADRNIISGNRGDGIDIIAYRNDPIGAFESISNVIEGNLIGVAADGTSPLGNGGDGMEMISSKNAIRHNVIGGNGGNGISMSGFYDVCCNVRVSLESIDNIIASNSIVGNRGNGIWFNNYVHGNAIGGTVAEGNLIANNGGAGVVFVDPAHTYAPMNSILSNRIVANGGLGIDLNGDGPTANDPLDVDFGPNGLQNYPVLTAMYVIGNSVMVSGRLDSKPGSTFTIQIFDEAAPASLRASFDVTTDENGTAVFAAPLTGSAAGPVIATASLLGQLTSEFSPPIAVGGAPATVPALSPLMLIALLVTLGAVATWRVTS